MPTHFGLGFVVDDKVGCILNQFENIRGSVLQVLHVSKLLDNADGFQYVGEANDELLDVLVTLRLFLEFLLYTVVKSVRR
jgi:hypothetical protein